MVIRGTVVPTVEAFVERIHRGLLKQFKHALVWGTSVKYNPQRVSPCDDSVRLCRVRGAILTSVAVCRLASATF